MGLGTVVVTGGARGIGLEVCKQLNKLGWDVILTARDAKRAEAAANSLGCKSGQLDMADRDSIERFASQLRDAKVEIKALVNNAGVVAGGERKTAGEIESMFDYRVDEIEETIRVNSFGPLYLTLATRDLMAKKGQIVMVSSVVGTICGDSVSNIPYYAASKTFLNMLTRQFAIAFKPREVRINAVHPGWVRSDMGGPNATSSLEEGADTIVWLATGGAGDASGKFFCDRAEISW